MDRTEYTFTIITMGCAKNEVDSARMKQALVQSGYRYADDPGDADVILVNTCSFLESATEESIEIIFEALALPHVEAGDAKVVVCGCMPARYKDDLATSLTEVQTFVPCAEEWDIVARVDAELGICGQITDGEDGEGEEGGEGIVNASTSVENQSFTPQSPQDAFCAPLFDLGTTSAYIKISEGCNRFCSFCAIPYIRGRHHSFSFEQIESDVAAALAAGAKELVLIAQDTGRWGEDLDGDYSLAWLIRTLAEMHPETWIRVMYLEPEGITDELLEIMATHDNVCSYLDIPLQHVSPEVLSRMNRTGSPEEFSALLAHIRRMVPGDSLRTTLIAGFPGEPEEDLDLLLAFLEEAQFDYVGVFAFSPEEGTRAFELDGQLDEEVRNERAQRIRDFSDAISVGIVEARCGQVVPVLIEGAEEDGQLVGRTQHQAPEVDGETYVDAGEVGEIVMARIVDTMMYEMEGEVQ